ncbi:MAG: O-antigen ligase family protein [Wolinella sp.]
MNFVSIFQQFKQKLSYEKFYFYAFLLFAFTMPLSRAAISLFTILLPLAWIIEGDFHRKFNEIKGSTFFIVFLLLYMLVILSVFPSENKKSALEFPRLYAYWLTMFVLFTSLKREWIRSVITAFLFGMVVSEIIAYGIFFDLWDFRAGAKSSVSPFMMHIDYSIYLAFTSVLLFSRIISAHYHKREKILMAIFFLSTTGNLFLQTGRTGQVAFIFAIGAMFFLRFRFTFKSLLYPVLSLLVIFTLAFHGSNNFNQRLKHTLADLQSIKSGNLNTSWGIRLAFYGLAYEIFKENPLLGVGVGDYRRAATEILQRDEFAHYPDDMREFLGDNHFHNQFLQVTVQMGIIGLSLTILLYFLAFRSAWRIKNSEYRAIFLVFLIIYTIGSFSDPLWIRQFTVIIWVLFVSLMLKYESFEKLAQNAQE